MVVEVVVVVAQHHIYRLINDFLALMSICRTQMRTITWAWQEAAPLSFPASPTYRGESWTGWGLPAVFRTC